MDRTQMQVLQFMQKAGQEIPLRPQLRSTSFDTLRYQLLKEEVGEFLDAQVDQDLVEIADALGDILYVAYGAALGYGIDLEPIMDEIHMSNMSKFPTSLREDGKVMKGPNFVPPDLDTVLSRQGWQGPNKQMRLPLET